MQKHIYVFTLAILCAGCSRGGDEGSVQNAQTTPPIHTAIEEVAGSAGNGQATQTAADTAAAMSETEVPLIDEETTLHPDEMMTDAKEASAAPAKSEGHEEPARAASTGTERIQFAKGTYSGRERGVVTRGEDADFVLRARAGQTMTVTVSGGEAPVNFAVTSNGSNLSGTTSQWSGELPRTGDYRIRVSLGSASPMGAADFELVVEVR